VHKILVGKPEGKSSLRRPWNRWEDNMRMNLGEIKWEGVDWIHLVSCHEHGNEHSDSV